MLAVKKVAYGVCEMLLKPQDQALAIRDLLQCRSRLLQPPQLRDVCAQMSHQPVYGPLACHELAERICPAWLVAVAGRTVCTRPVTTS